MPRINGLQFLSEIKNEKRFNNIPIVIYSTTHNPREKEIAYSLGATHFITKPYTFSDIQQELHFVLAEKLKNIHS
jgi:CheY-like chemotaxis protein